MENLVLSAENIFCHLRQNRLNKIYLQIIKLLDNVEKHGCECKKEQYKILEEVLQIIPRRTERCDGAVILSSVILLTCLQEQQKLPCLNETQFANLWEWLLEHYKRNEISTEDKSRIIIAFGNLFSLHPENCDKYFIVALQQIIENISFNIPEILLVTSLQCLNKIFSSLRDVHLSEEQCAACEEAGHKMLQLHYGDDKPNITSSSTSVVILSTLQVLNKIVALNLNFAKQQTGELLGLSKTYFHYGIDTNEVSLLKPQKVKLSQQALYDSAEEMETALNSEKVRNCGGKTPKTRKPRAVVKNSRSSDYKALNRGPENGNSSLLFDIKTSDSEMSEPENATNRILFERSRKAKIRLASITLVASIARSLERKVIFGYWHALFPSGTADSHDNLLFIGQHDPNLRCRSAALQVSTHLLYGSKGYLHQAEINIKRCPTTFIPFSVSLGYTVLAIYKSLTAILSAESSLPVLTQALKCLAVLVQATPFKQLENGFVQEFLKDVKPLIYHRDAAIQVSALMVMEFLLALPEPTGDIAKAIGLPQEAAAKNRSVKQNLGHEQDDVVDIEEYVESEDEDCSKREISQETTKAEFSNVKSEEAESSWLLRRVLDNLSQQEKMMPTSVRIESLQVLIVMSSHFAIIQPHLTKVAEVLLYSLKDALPDLRLYAARCVDACAYQISRHLADKTICTAKEIQECHNFWANMLPLIMKHIRRDSEEMTTVRIALCDALSNIGVFMFEHTPHTSQISLLSFLSGVSSDSSEDTLVRAAGVRALAVYAIYPSLRGDLVFIENTAELTLRLVKDSNLLVRVKTFWSLGNISDALIGPGLEVEQLRYERISDDLLFRLITAATAACSDNDKVRCNAVRTLGNLLRLLNGQHLNSVNWQQAFVKSISKLSDCIRSSGNAKVKWNTCYAITNLMRNPNVFKMKDLGWQDTLFSSLCHVIVHQSNFKVRINASAAITNITERSHFGVYFEKFWSSVLEAIVQSYNLENFHEYNHRDSLQEQLCLAVSHIVRLSLNDDLVMLEKHLMPRAEIIHHTWKRVVNRMVPEKAAPLASCSVVLLEKAKHLAALSLEQKKILDFLVNILSTE